MSYILEALKKSQRERELGQVPRLQASVFDEPLEQTRTQRWIIATFALAALAVVLAFHASFRPPSADALGPGSEELVAVASAVEGRTRAIAPMADADADVDADTRDAERDLEPQVLVVPAPPKPGERLPRGAEELRRAVLGDDASSADGSSVLAQDAPTRAKAPTSAPAPEHVPEHAPIPPDLIAEIEAFKRAFREEGDQESSAGAQSASTRTRLPALTPLPEPASKPASNSASKPAEQGIRAAASLRDRPALLSSDLRRELPSFSMTVHVYDPDPARRFVYLNGSKLREGELARDGFFVEEVRADGAVLRYDEHRFFQSP